MQEAAQRRGIRGLTNLAMRAVNKIFSPSTETLEISSIIKGTEESIELDLELIQVTLCYCLYSCSLTLTRQSGYLLWTTATTRDISVS
jgi:hypothetical protein